MFTSESDPCKTLPRGTRAPHMVKLNAKRHGSPFVKTLRDSGNICHVSRHVTQGLLLLVTEQIKFQFPAQKKLFLKQEVFLEKDLIGT